MGEKLSRQCLGEKTSTFLNPVTAGLLLAVLIHFAVFLGLGLSRHWGYMSSINDLGVFDQVVWNTLQGNFFATTINPFGQSINWLGFHFHPVLLFFVPLYAITPSAEWFIVAQAISLSLTAWPIFLLARHVFQDEKTALMWALVYLANPFQLSAGAWDFHPVSLAVPFLALALLGLVKKNFRLLFISSFLILICQEHFGLTVVGLGLLWWIRHRNWPSALALVALGSLHLALVLGVVMPYFSPVSGPVMLGEQLGQLSRYSWLGTSLTEVIHTLATQPIVVVKQLIEMGGLSYWLLLVIPLGIIFPMLGMEFVLAGLADLVANTLSANPMPRAILSYHSVGLVPVLTVAAIYGVARLASWQNRFSSKELTGLVMIAAFFMGYIVFPAPLPGAANAWGPIKFKHWPDPAAYLMRVAIGDGTSLAAQANVGAQFSQRQEIYLYPNKVGDVDQIIFHLASPTTKVNNYPGPVAQRKHQPNWLDGHLQMDRVEYLASIECLLSGDTYGVALWADPWLVLGREAKSGEVAITEKISQLREDWQVDEEEYQEAVLKCGGSEPGEVF